MTKADIVNEISRSTGLEKAAVLATVEKFMEVVKDSMAAGHNVYLRGFGSFVIKTRKGENRPQHFQEHNNQDPRAQRAHLQAF